MTCICPSPTSELCGVPELKQLAKMSCSRLARQNVISQKNFINSRSNILNTSTCRRDSLDNNEKERCIDHEPMNQDPPIFYTMRYEANRLKSFEKGWPVPYIKPEDCAAVGLFYLGESDRVQCAFCRGIIASWDEGDQPLREHVKHFPMCPYMLHRDVGNVPISGNNGCQKWQTSNSHAERVRPINYVNQNRPTSHSFSAKYPSMACFDKRLQTYTDWPSATSTSTITPVELAESGLFYSGVADVVTCFCCGGSMGNWSSGDVSWIEHAKHFPTCAFVKSTKGSAFIEQARKKYISEPAATNGVQECRLPSAHCIESATSKTTESPVNICEKVNSLTVKESEASNQEHKFMCKICMEFDTRVAFIPCGHSLACPSCARELQTCPLCRSKIQSVVRLYFD